MVMHRRLFLRLAAVGTVSTLTGSGCARTDDDADLRALARPGLLELMGREPVLAIGARYRELVPDERNVTALHAAIHGRHPILVRLLGAPDANVAHLVRQDFAENRIIEVDGWVLSVTEARQCALYSLARA